MLPGRILTAGPSGRLARSWPLWIIPLACHGAARTPVSALTQSPGTVTRTPSFDTYFPDLEHAGPGHSGQDNTRADELVVSATDDGPPDHTLALLRFELDDLKQGSLPESATLVLYLTYCQADETGELTLSVGRVDEDWLPHEMNGLKVPAFTIVSRRPIIRRSDAVKQITNRELRIDVTKTAAEWLGGQANRGLMLLDEEGGLGIFHHTYCGIGSSESDTPPELRLTYPVAGTAYLPATANRCPWPCREP